MSTFDSKQQPVRTGNAAERIEASGFEPLASAAATGGGGWRPSPLKLALGAVLLLFALAMLFLFTARSVEIAVLPADGQFADTLSPQVEIDGLALPFGQRYLLRQGEYPLRVQASGYTPFEEMLQVGPEDTQRREILLQPLPGQLSISGAPDTASLYVDDAFLSRAPFAAVSIAAGERQLRVEAPRYFSAERSLLIEGRERLQQIELPLEPAWADITLQSEPAGAQILLDGDPVGQTPVTIEVLAGERQLVLQAPGYANLEQRLTVSAGEAQDLGTLVLQPAAGLLTLGSEPSGANVTVDGEFRGQTPLELELEPGRAHQLMVSRPGYTRYRETISMQAGEALSRTLRLEAQLGEVVFEIRPAEAELRINGKSAGRGSQTLSLPASEQRVEVVLEGYASVRRRVTPRPGLAQRVRVELLTEQAARMARIQPEITTALGQTLRLFNPAESARNEFSMGASRRDPGRRANEVMHPVRLERMFYLQTTEVTNAQFRQFLAEHNSGQVQGNSLNREHQPVAQVSWQQAAAFSNWLSRREGLPPFYREQQGIIVGFDPDATGYRLPTEAEWAWASRVKGEEVQTFSWGEAFPPPANAENLADAASAHVTGRVLSEYRDAHVVSAPVASFSPNHHGLYDMGGNVAEWMHDVYTIPAASAVLQVDPLGAQQGDNYAIRGGSWALGRRTELRLSYRDYGAAGRDDLGFRLARYAE